MIERNRAPALTVSEMVTSVRATNGATGEAGPWLALLASILPSAGVGRPLESTEILRSISAGAQLGAPPPPPRDETTGYDALPLAMCAVPTEPPGLRNLGVPADSELTGRSPSPNEPARVCTKSDSVLDADGSLEVSFPWRLLPGEGLSYRLPRAEQLPVLGASPILCPPRVAAPAFVAPSPMLIPELEDGQENVHLGRESVAKPLARAEAIAASPATEAPEGPAPAYAPPSPTTWAPTQLRFQGEGDQVTAYLRDYWLVAADVTPLLPSIRKLALDQGVIVRRVVFNGNEIWRSSPPIPSQQE